MGLPNALKVGAVVTLIGLEALIAACGGKATSMPTQMAPVPLQPQSELPVLHFPVPVLYFPDPVNCFTTITSLRDSRDIQLTTISSDSLTRKVGHYEMDLVWEPKEPLRLDGIYVSGYTIPPGASVHVSVVIREEPPDYQEAIKTGFGPKPLKTCTLIDALVTEIPDHLALPARFDLNPGTRYFVGMFINGQNPFEVTLMPVNEQFYVRGGNEEGVALLSSRALQSAGEYAGSASYIEKALPLTLSVTPRK